MADEKPPLGGDLNRVLGELRRLDAKLDSVRADVSRLKSEAPSGRVARDARTEARGARPADEAAEQRQAGRAVEDTNRKLADQSRIQKQVTSTVRESAASRRSAAADAILQRGPRDIEALRNQTAALAQVQAGASREMRKHGALTTEFLSAAARGDATLGEFRYQIGATIAKFAGWTAAGAAVFGVLGALRELGRGALDALNGVNLLSRVMPELQKNAGARQQAGRGLIDLSQQFNLPIGDVSEAAFGFAQVYKNVPDVLNATRAALYAVKVGELDAADATRLLISTGQGLGITGTDLVGIFDQINQAQNVFGVRIKDTVAGAAKASGAFRAAGGDFSHLLALITVGSRVSGRTGEQLGTALQRSAGLVRRPINQQLLRQFGIDPSQNIQAIFEQAIKIAPGLASKQQLQLARALSTPQLAPYLVGILQHGDLYKQVLAKTSPEASKGSAQRELNQQLKSAREQLSQFGVTLQRVGAGLAQLGAFDAFGGLLKTLNLSLSALDHLLRLANELPAPMRKAGIYALEFYAALRLARRFNVGGALVGTPAQGLSGFLQQSPLQRGQRYVQRSIANELGALEREREQVANKLLSRQLALETGGIAANQARTQVAVSQRFQGKPGVQAIQTAERDLLRKEAAVTRLQQEIAALNEEQAYLATRIAGAKEKQVLASKYRTQGDLLAGESGRVVPPVGRGSGPPTHLPPKALAATLEQEAAAVGTQATSNARLASASRVLGPALKKGRNAATAVARTVSGAGAAAAGLGSALLASLGPLDLVIGALIAVPFVIERIQKLTQQTKEMDKQAGRSPGTAAEAHDILKKYKAESASGRSAVDRASNPRVTDLLHDYLTYFHGGVDPEDLKDLQYENAKVIAEAQRKSPISSGKKNLLLGADTLQNQVNEAARLRATGVITLAQFDDRLSTALKDIAGNNNLTKKQKAKLKQSIRDARTSLGSDALSQLEIPDLDKLLTSYTDIAGSGAASSGARSAAIKNAARVLAARASRAPFDPKLIGAEDAYIKGVTESAQTTLKRGLLYARTLDDQNAAYDKAEDELRRGIGLNDSQIKRTQASKSRHNARIRQLESLRNEAGRPGIGPLLGLGADSVGAFGGGALKAIDEQIAQEKAKAKADTTKLKGLRKARRDLARALGDQIKQLQDEQVEKQQGILDLRAQISAVATGSQASSTAILLRRAGQKVTAYIRQFGRDDQRTLQAILEQRQLQQQAAQAAIANVGADYDISIAQTQDPVRKAQLGVSKVQAQLRRAKGDQRKQLLAEYYNALASLDQARLDEANAEFELQKSRTNDPVKQAAIQLRQDQYNLQHARGRTAKLNAQAQLNRDRFAQAETKAQDKIDEAEFLRSIGKLTNDAEVGILKSLLHQKNLSKSTRRQIQKLIYDLTHEGSDLSNYELTVGNVRLPTTYEVRRAAQEGQNASRSFRTNISNTNTFQIRVEKDADLSKVFDVIDEAIGTSTRSNMRSAGVL